MVYVATPHSAHHGAAALCLQAGKVVVCEKPFTLNLAQARDLVDMARERSAFLMEAMWAYVNPAVLRMRELIADGAIGEVRSVYADFSMSLPYDATHRLHDPLQGGGSLLDLGVYPVSFAHLLLGVPDSVSARTHLNPQGVDDNTGILLGYDSGPVAVLSCSLGTKAAQRASVQNPGLSPSSTTRSPDSGRTCRKVPGGLWPAAALMAPPAPSARVRPRPTGRGGYVMDDRPAVVTCHR